MKEVLTVHTGMKDAEAADRCVEMLKRVHMPDAGNVMHRYPHQISGGQQQRVVIAMALLNNPVLLIMDEPTTALDVTVEAVVLDLVAELRTEFDTAIMFITHNLGVVARTCDKVGVMYAGEMVEFATVGDSETILNLTDLKKYYPVHGNTLKDVFGLGEKREVKALERASFKVSQGRTLGIVGESGCGKSTLLKTVIGLEAPSGGEAQFLGFDISQHIKKRDERLIRELQMVFQNPDSTLNPAYTVGWQIGRPMARFKTVPRGDVHDEVIRLLKAMRLSEAYYDRLPRQLSGGEKQRVGIARALACRPDLVLCDEPVSALDVSVQAAIMNLLMEVQEEFGTTLIFISHDLSVVRFISDYVCVMY